MKSRHTSADRGLLLLRLALGLVFVMHGWQKLAVIGHAGVAGFMTQLGIPFPDLSAYMVTGVEFAGGLALLLGVFTRVAAFLIAGNMAVAIATAHITKGFFLPAGYEFALTLLLVSAAVMFMGAGAYSVDKLMEQPDAPVQPSYRVAA